RGDTDEWNPSDRRPRRTFAIRGGVVSLIFTKGRTPFASQYNGRLRLRPSILEPLSRKTSDWNTANNLPTRWPSIGCLAKKTVDPTIKPELKRAAVCEEVSDRIDDHAIQNEPHDTLISAGLTWGPGGSGARSTAAS